MDTACFYTDGETQLDRRLQKAKYLLWKRKGAETRSEALRTKHIHKLNKVIAETKEALKSLIDANAAMVREVREESLQQKNVVAVFDSALGRALGMREHEVNEELIIIKVYFYGVAESIIKNGFVMHGQRYVFFTASAGQIRKKMFVAIRENDYRRVENRLTCGLSLAKINAAGGINTNKYLAYLALCASATDPWPEFDIRKSIVVPDFETKVRGVVDFIDEKDYSITRKEMDVPVPHTDGCGMILPSVSKVNFMFRAPWIKGLLASFPFDKFVREERRGGNIECGVIKDVYGREHDILAEGIEIIFTASQFKTWKYYDSWDEYCENFQKWGCEAGKCNVEEPIVANAKFNYQMLQTLPSLSEDELEKLAEKTNSTLKNISADRNTMLKVFGATDANPNKNPFQKCLALYPELLQDPYTRETLRDIRNSLEKYGKAARFDVDGKYLFVIPDLYAACEFWFKGEEIPKGLLDNGEIYCRMYKYETKLDCLRSPHLYREHAVRRNVAGEEERKELRRWFNTNGIYTSTHDLITKIVQCDCDGDKFLVCADKTIIAAAERECVDIVPLFYNMSKAPARIIDSQALWEGMQAAWKFGNIGEVSNKITKIWNSKTPDIDAIKRLCCLNNFVIDAAKTLVKYDFPPEIGEYIGSLTKGKVPHFFIYAKDKAAVQVASEGNGCVDRFARHIKHYKFDFKKKQLGELDYKMMMDNPELEITEQDKPLLDTYYALASTTNCRMVMDKDGKNNYDEVFNDIRTKLLVIDPDISHVVDVLVKQLFDVRKAKHKTVFWSCFGEEVYENLKRNVPDRSIMCKDCGTRIVNPGVNQVLCSECQHIHMLEKNVRYRQKQRETLKAAT